MSDACIKHCLYFVGTNDSVDVTCTDGSVRLVGGINEFEGSLEICYNRFWGSVCDSSWNSADANVACKQLGHQPTGIRIVKVDFCYAQNVLLIKNVHFMDQVILMLFYILIVGATVFTGSFFGYGTSRTHIMSSLYCTTRANTLFDCSYSSLSAVTSCGDENIAGVVCQRE